MLDLIGERKLNFKDFIAKIEKGLQAKNDYQRLVLCSVINAEDMTISRRDVSIKVMDKTTSPLPNQHKQNPEAFYYSRIPVWNVLLNKGMIQDFKSNGDLIKLTIRPNEEQKADLMKLCRKYLK